MLAPYTTWLLVFNVFPVLFLWAIFYNDLKIYYKTFLVCIAFSSLVGTLWDLYAIHMRIWYWPPNCCSLPKIGSLPPEEIIFMVFTSSLIVTLTILGRNILAAHGKYGQRSKR